MKSIIRKKVEESWSSYTAQTPSLIESEKRMLVDNFISREEALLLKRFAMDNVIEGAGYHGEKYPHQKDELYSSYNLINKEISQGKGPEFKFLVETQYKILKWVSLYFNEPNLKIMISQLVSRKALIEREIDPWTLQMSHPFHLDENIEDTEDRTYSAVLFLNDDFVGGKFIFKESDYSVRRVIAPKPGRLVAFKSMENYHGVSQLFQGTRYVFIFWFSRLTDK